MSDILTLLPAGTGQNVTGATFDSGDLHDTATLQVAIAGTPSAWTIIWQGSLDGVTWEPVGAAVSATGAVGSPAASFTGTTATFLFAVMLSQGLYRYFRASTGALTGTGVSVKAVMGFGKI